MNIEYCRKVLFSLLLCWIFNCCLAVQPDSLIMRVPKSNLPLPKISLKNRSLVDLTNLVVFIRFADDEEINHSFNDIDKMFNDSTAGAVSVYNYFDVMSYGKIHYNTIYTNQIKDTIIISYRDSHPRKYYEPYSRFNPDGYEPFPAEGVCPRERVLLAEALHYIDSLHLVDSTINLDGNEDGYIDNISFVIKGGCGNWADLLWPHMQFISQDSVDVPYTISVNGVIPYTYNFELEGDRNYFTTNTFCHEMCHSLGLPDFYHYYHYTNVDPVGIWDMMASTHLQQVSTILKYKFLGLTEEPVQITEDGTYLLYSNGSSDVQNCYYIKSAIDSTQWYTFEYRDKSDFMDNLYNGGLIIGRWVDTMDLDDLDHSGDAMFDYYNEAHSYWVFRPESNSDTIQGQCHEAYFGTGRTSFGPTTDPYPYLTDGTPEKSFEITDIERMGAALSFHVHFLNTGIHNVATDSIRVFPNPTSSYLHLQGASITRIEITDLTGSLLLAEDHPDGVINLSSLSNGVYLVKCFTENGTCVKKVVKK